MTAQKTARYFNRESSWLEFNSRVLAEGMDAGNPLLERLKFIGIVSSNFDEFFMVRVASLIDEKENALSICAKAFQIIEQKYNYFQTKIIPELEAAGIKKLSLKFLNDDQMAYVKKLFFNELMPLLTPISIDAHDAMPLLTNLTIYLMVRLEGPQDKKATHYAVVAMPKNFQRLISLPSSEGYQFVLIEDLVSYFADQLFTGYQIMEQGFFRLTRAAELDIDEEKDDDFAKIMTEAVRSRRQNEVVRLETSASDELITYLKNKLSIPDFLICKTSSWLDLKSVSQLSLQPSFEQLKHPVWEPRRLPEFDNSDDIWALLKQTDIMVHHPYETFDTTARFVKEAAMDPDVLAIKQTLYRSASHSTIVSSLVHAAENGKEVTVLVELKARFDEENNILWARRLEQAGVNVLYGIAGYKTHAKACLVIRREADGIKKYAHLATGNYNEKTAATYSDIGFFTSNEQITNELSVFFNVITGYSQPIALTKLTIAPYGLRRKLKSLIQREIFKSRSGEAGLIIAKMNSLVDSELIDALYEASKAGVQIKLNVRGICCLIPGVPGLSEHIEVISIVDMFLEHTRMFYFNNGGDSELFLSSADWMPRNLDRRIELMFPIEDKKIKKTLLEILQTYFKDQVKAWTLMPDGSYKKREAGDDKKFRAQEYLCAKAIDREKKLERAIQKELKPQRPKDSI